MPTIRGMLGGRRVKLDDTLIATWEPSTITIEFADGRKQVVRYREEGEFYIFRSRVVTSRIAWQFDEGRLACDILRRNRAVDAVAFIRARNGDVEGRIVQRIATLQREELLFFLKTLAREADRFEMYLTGRDRE